MRNEVPECLEDIVQLKVKSVSRLYLLIATLDLPLLDNFTPWLQRCQTDFSDSPYSSETPEREQQEWEYSSEAVTSAVPAGELCGSLW